ncbi:hypothetical protein MAPG_06071 [Magnaporthiopsis poae ATCC 64411]|uniref:Protein kinase domain-containing protein n=1 Tax=Magnaporthiopsis poae (strain ATCC 64411 / 73-15) TaxID=644358 RepID=A0A0C4E128_MAGP6|nr:hypothetical protein MAPG_06071 [Magnaporthiopsis poae ATCC 64411]
MAAPSGALGCRRDDYGDDAWVGDDSEEPEKGKHATEVGKRTISAIAEAPWPPWDHALRLDITHGPFAQWLASVLPPWLPQPVQIVARAYFPGWFLPARIVAKNLKPDWDGEFDNEIATYRRVQELQPLNSVPAHEQKWPPVELDEYRRRAAAAIDEMHRPGVSPGDVKLGNTILTPDSRLVFVDLEMAYTESRPPPPPPPPGFVYPNNPLNVPKLPGPLPDWLLPQAAVRGYVYPDGHPPTAAGANGSDR